MAVLFHLQPAMMFDFFEQICNVPHASGNRSHVVSWLKMIADKNDLKCFSDEYDNVVIVKEASPGYENIEPIILQAHTDMVCEKDKGTEKDFDTDPITLQIDGDVVSALGTTLGADNGIGVAMILSVLCDKSLKHPKIEALFTSDEEIGMIGAAHLNVNMLESKRMINIDSDEEGVFTVGCAGGNVSKCILPVTREWFDGECYEIEISGLNGGHSGTEINSGRANANVLMSRLINLISNSTDIRICTINGGNKDNAICVCSKAVICVKNFSLIENIIKVAESDFKKEYSNTEPDITIACSESEYILPMDMTSGKRALCLITVAPNGVQEMSGNVEGLVQTSLNLGILKTESNRMVASYCVRSSVESQKCMICDRLKILTETLGGIFEIEGDYPAWEFNHSSILRDLMIEVYNKQYGSDPIIKIIHAGLECGVFSSKISDFDCVSIGPELIDIHTTGERFSVASAVRVYDMLVEVLKDLK